MIMQATVSSRSHPEYGVATIPLPIPDGEYGPIIELLEAMGIGDATAQDCWVYELSSDWPALRQLESQSVNVDELDFVGTSSISLASAFGESSLIPLPLLPKSKPLRWVSIWLPRKRLDSFCGSEKAQFQAMVSVLGLSDVKELINLTFCCQQVTSSGQAPYPSLPPSAKARSFRCPSSPNRNRCAGFRFGFAPHQQETLRFDLIQSGTGVVTPFGVAYDNGMVLEQVYVGGTFPPYQYRDALLTLGVPIQPEIGGPVETAWLYLPAPEQQLDRTLRRIGITNGDAAYFIEDSTLPPEVFAVLERPDDAILELDRLCQAVAPLDGAQREKLAAVVLMAQPEEAGEIRQLAKNLDQFDFLSVSDGSMQQVTKLGCVAYHGTLTLDKLMSEDPAEAYQREQQIGGLA